MQTPSPKVFFKPRPKKSPQQQQLILQSWPSWPQNDRRWYVETSGFPNFNECVYSSSRRVFSLAGSPFQKSLFFSSHLLLLLLLFLLSQLLQLFIRSNLLELRYKRLSSSSCSVGFGKSKKTKVGGSSSSSNSNSSSSSNRGQNLFSTPLSLSLV